MPLSGTVGPNDVGVMTQEQMTTMLKASNFVYSPVDTAISKWTKAHPGPNFRSSTSSCSVHANILPGTGVDGVPARADFHIDLINPLIPGSAVPEPESAAAHGAADVIPDLLRGRGVNVPTGNQLCRRSNEATKSNNWSSGPRFRSHSICNLLCGVHCSQNWG